MPAVVRQNRGLGFYQYPVLPMGHVQVFPDLLNDSFFYPDFDADRAVLAPVVFIIDQVTELCKRLPSKFSVALDRIAARIVWDTCQRCQSLTGR
jgi:hypothetical protein